MRPYAKPPRPHRHLLRLLQERGLAAQDRRTALLALRRIGYYRLSGYWLAFKRPDDSLEPGVTLELVLALYELDRRLRILALDAIERVEVAVRSAIADLTAARYGAFGHLDPKNFRPSFDPRRRVTHAQWLASVSKAAARSKELFVDHHRRTPTTASRRCRSGRRRRS